jgi:hypothetical protein
VIACKVLRDRQARVRMSFPAAISRGGMKLKSCGTTDYVRLEEARVKKVCEFGTKSDKKLGYLHCRVDGGAK